MGFVKTKYETNAGSVVNIRLSDSVAAVTGNAAPGGAVDDPLLTISAASNSSRKSWPRGRGVRLRRSIGTVGEGSDAREVFEFAVITCLTVAAQTTIGSATSVTYAGQSWTPISLISEG